MYPEWWNRTVTLYNKYKDENNKVKYNRVVVDGCFVSRGTLKQLNGTISINDSSYVCRFRYKDDLKINTGDIIITKVVEDEIDENDVNKTSNKLLKKYLDESFVVKNTKINLDIDPKHYYASGD